MVRELTIKEGIWMKREEENQLIYEYCVEKAPSGRSKCNKCGSVILKGEIRVGIPLNDPRGTYGVISAWQHVSCTHIPISKGKCMKRKRIYGLQDFSRTEQKKLVETLRKKPSVLPEMDPEDCVVQRDLVERNPPSELRQQLFGFQKQGLGWLIALEERIEADEKAAKRPFSVGGILADEMGMGKTIQCIALILARKVHGPTLVVSPLSSMLQWKEEIDKHVIPNALTVYVYHGIGTHASMNEIQKYDIVLTTYQTIERQWQKLIHSKKIVCEVCGKRLLPRKMKVHRQYFCGEDAQRTAKQKKQEKKQSYETIAKGLNTLKVIQGNIEMEDQGLEKASERSENEAVVDDDGFATGGVTPWKIFNDLTNRIPVIRKLSKTSAKKEHSNALPVIQNVQNDETRPPNESIVEVKERSELDQRDVEGYESTSLDFTLSPVHDIQWTRIILDEAHRIKSKTTSTARSAYALKGRFKLCVTGTPLQNRVGDMYSLLRFLRLEQFSRYYCQKKGCMCTSLSYPFTIDNHRHCIYCGHSPLSHYSYFNKHILNPIRRYGYVGCGHDAMIRLKECILDRIMLRRRKAVVRDLDLPPLEVRFAHVNLKPDERDFYEALYKQSEAKFDSFVEKGTLVNNYAHIFDLLSSLRQSLDHPFLVLHRPSLESVSTESGISRQWAADICIICHDTICKKHALQTKPCMHTFHKKCIYEYIQNIDGENLGCPRCYTPLTIDMNSIQISEEESDEEKMDPVENMSNRTNVHALINGLDEEERFTLPCPPADNLTQHNPLPEHGKTIKSKKPLGRRNILQRFDVADFKSSSKLDAIINYIKTIPPKEKIIIFSQYASMLDLIEWLLEKEDYKTAKLLGSMPLTMRRSLLNVFREEMSDIRIILISLRAGGEGLNLQIANHIILVDPWWNPAVEWQAIQRAHRIGQKKPVFATRFICRDTIEDRMIELQEKKMLVFNGTVDSNQCAMSKLTSEDMLFLFAR